MEGMVKEKIFIPLGMLVVLLFTGILAHNYISQIDVFWRSTVEQIALTTEKHEKDIHAWFRQKMWLVESICNDLVYFELSDPAELERYFTRVTAEHRDLSAAYLGTADKRHVFDNGQKPPEGYDPTARIWYRLATQQSGKVVASEPYIDVLSNKLVVTLSKTVQLGSGMHGVVAIDLFLSELADFVNSVRPYATGASFLFSREGNIVAHADPAYLPQDRGGTEVFVKYADIPVHGVRQTSVTNPHVSVERLVVGGVEKYVSRIAVRDVGWFYGNAIPVSTFDDNLADIAQPLIVTFVFGLIISASSIAFCLALVIASQKRSYWYENILDSIPLPMSITDMERKCTFINKASEDFLGIRRADALGRPCYDIWKAEICDTEHCGITRLESGESSTLFEHGGRHLKIDVSYLTDSQQRKTGHIEVVHDITHIQRMRMAAEAANTSKSRFLASMSHEIRTPMNAILGISEIALDREAADPAVREAFQKICHAGHTLMGIINDILDLSKIETGKFELVPANYEIASLISDTVQLNIMRIGDKPVEFHLSLSEDVPSVLFGDELRIKQVLNNLLTNAIKYTAEGHVALEVEVRTEQDAAWLVFIVRDTGQGMTREQLAALYDIYSQFNREANRAIEGAGLGMGITKSLVEMMQGTIQAQSEPGVGSVFIVRLRQQLTGSGTLGRELAENLRSFRTPGGAQMRKEQIVRDPMPYGRVLIVDDVEVNLVVAEGLMEPYGLTIETAGSGFEALKAVRAGETYDIIFMDHMMPQMDGIETTRRIRQEGYTLPIVALTANAIVGQADVFFENGFDDFLSKPIDVCRLNEILNALIRDRRASETGMEARRRHKDGSADGEA